MSSWDRALFDNNDIREDKFLPLDMVKTVSQKDANHLNAIVGQLTPQHPYFNEGCSLLERAENLKVKAADIESRWHDNDLPPIPEPTNNSYCPQNSIDIEVSEFDY